MVDISYPVTIAAAKTWFKLGRVKVKMEGTEHIPRKGGAMLAVNHTSYIDYVMAGYPGESQGRYTRFMAKREIFDHPVGGPVMRSYHHISVDRSAGLESMEIAEKALRSGEVVGIFPEATISRSFLIKELKTGAARIAAKAEVPLIPVVTWGSHRMFTKDHPKDFKPGKTVLIKVGEPLHPTGEDPLAETALLHERMTELLDACIREYPAEEQPPAPGGSPPPTAAPRPRSRRPRRSTPRRSASARSGVGRRPPPSAPRRSRFVA
ncbi:lysophospholipid acyltransferase family protein [Nocardioides alcanivorans]|uniref:lysophospholipid acyltransferase family protein n=1 Tax=Nocardioides alcanivorans TaxID=2897352 RepID=UPI001F485F32|nr:lysophospholipid acyltransferase family protein [Nocardioides alcanivorans]